MAVGLWGLVACAGAPPAPPKRPAQIPVTREPVAEPVRIETPEPKALLALVHFKNPEGLVQGLLDNIEDDELAGALPLDAATLVQAVLDPEVVGAVDLSAPLALALFEEEGDDELPVAAYAMTLREHAKGSSQPAPPLELDALPHCVRHQALVGPTQLVCSETGAVTDNMLAIFDHMAARSFAGDVLVEIPREALEHAKAEAEAEAETEPVPSDPDAALGYQLADELTRSLQSLALELSLRDGRFGVGVELGVDPSSAFVPTLLVGNAPTALPPEFLGLPDDANVALSLTGIRRSELAAAAAPVWQRFADNLALRLPRAQARAFVAELGKLVFTGGPLLVASGPPGAREARLLQLGKDAQERRLGLQGWWCFGTQEPLEHWTKGIQKLLKIEQQTYPVAPDEPAKVHRDPSPTVSYLRQHPLPPRSGLPKGTLHLRLWETRNPDYVLADDEEPPFETTTYIYVTAKPSTTWIVGSEHDRLALEKARELLRAKPSPARARYFRPAGVQQARLLGFATLRGLAMPFWPVGSSWEVMTAEQSLDDLDEWTHAAEFPLRYSVVTRDAHTYARLDVEFPSFAVDGLIQMLMRMIVMSQLESIDLPGP